MVSIRPIQSDSNPTDTDQYFDPGHAPDFVECILAALELNKPDTANKYLNNFENYSNEREQWHEHVSLNIMMELCKALILKKTKSLGTTLKAKKILEKILENPNIKYQVQVRRQ